MAENKRKKKLETLTTESTENIVIDNTAENVIKITESKARLIYDKHIKRGKYGELSLTFFGLFLTCLITLLTTNFKNVFGIKNSSIFLMAMFAFAAVLFFGLTIYTVIRWVLDRKKYNIENFISDLKEKR